MDNIKKEGSFKEIDIKNLPTLKKNTSITLSFREIYKDEFNNNKTTFRELKPFYIKLYDAFFK